MKKQDNKYTGNIISIVLTIIALDILCMDVIKWKTEYAPKSMDEEWHPCFVEALQNISKVEYQLDTLLEKDIPDRASVVSDIGKGVKSIAGRIEEYRRSQGDAGEHRKGRSQENSR